MGSVIQFKKVALMTSATAVTGANRFVVMSPVAEGADGATRTILAIEPDEEIVIEDNQTVLSKLSETINCVAMLDESSYANLSDWAREGYKVGFAGYTIGGLGIAPQVTFDFTVRETFNGNAEDSGTPYANNPSLYDISDVNVVNASKRMLQFKLTKHTIGGVEANTGVRRGINPSTNFYDSNVAWNFATTSQNAPPAYSSSPDFGDLEYASNASGVLYSSANTTGVKEFSVTRVFPFPDALVSHSATLYGATGVNVTGSSISLEFYNATGGIIGSAVTGAFANSTSTQTVTATIPSNTIFLRTALDVAYTSTTGALGVSAISLNVLK